MQTVRDIAMGLQQLHSKGIAHLNLMPRKFPCLTIVENILVSCAGKIKISNFGRAKLQHQPNDIEKFDIFSLGIIAWELMEGQQYLMEGSEPLETMRKEGPQFSHGLQLFSNECRQMVEAMLDKDPAKRPTAE